MYECIQCKESFTSIRLDIICSKKCHKCFRSSKPESRSFKNKKQKLLGPTTISNSCAIPIEYSFERDSSPRKRRFEERNTKFKSLKNANLDILKKNSISQRDNRKFLKNVWEESGASDKNSNITQNSDLCEPIKNALNELIVFENDTDCKETLYNPLKTELNESEVSEKDSEFKTRSRLSIQPLTEVPKTLTRCSENSKANVDFYSEHSGIQNKKASTEIIYESANVNDLELEYASLVESSSSSPEPKSSSDSEYEASKFPDFFPDLNKGKLKYCDSYLKEVRFEEIGKTDEGKKPYRCKICNITFFSRLHFKNHRKLHLEKHETLYTGRPLRLQYNEASTSK